MIQKEPLNKPRGTIRAYLALGTMGAFLSVTAGAAAYLLKTGNVDGALGLVTVLAAQAATITGFYFGSRPNGYGVMLEETVEHLDVTSPDRPLGFPQSFEGDNDEEYGVPETRKGRR